MWATCQSWKADLESNVKLVMNKRIEESTRQSESEMRTAGEAPNLPATQ